MIRLLIDLLGCKNSWLALLAFLVINQTLRYYKNTEPKAETSNKKQVMFGEARLVDTLKKKLLSLDKRF